ncbi:MFS transporter, partial [Intrasporangium sp.]|uniref:MFS transporter n=1 Tax=Intrasporangium sp. TaxID=1925024 RepID=UPI0039C8A957
MNQVPVRTRGYTATVVAGSFAVLLAQVAYSLPGALNGTFQQEFQATGAQLTWITAAFAIPMVVFELTTGVIGDLFGRKRLLQAGAALTVVGSLICAVAATVQVMWLGQIVAGLGAAILYPISLAMIAALAPDNDARAKAIALWAGFLSIGAAISPLMGGAFAASGYWRRAYVVVIVLAIASILITTKATDSSAPQGRPARSGDAGPRPHRRPLRRDPGLRVGLRNADRGRRPGGGSAAARRFRRHRAAHRVPTAAPARVRQPRLRRGCDRDGHRHVRLPRDLFL